MIWKKKGQYVHLIIKYMLSSRGLLVSIYIGYTYSHTVGHCKISILYISSPNCLVVNIVVFLLASSCPL